MDMFKVDIGSGVFEKGSWLLMEVEIVYWFGVNWYIVCWVIVVLIVEGFLCVD